LIWGSFCSILGNIFDWSATRMRYVRYAASHRDVLCSSLWHVPFERLQPASTGSTANRHGCLLQADP